MSRGDKLPVCRFSGSGWKVPSQTNKKNRREDFFQPGIVAPATTPGEVPQRCPRSWAERSHLCEPGGGAASVVRFWEAIKVVTRTLQSSFSGGSGFLFCGIASLGGLAGILSREIDLLFSPAGVASRSSSRCRLWDDGCGDLGGIWVAFGWFHQELCRHEGGLAGAKRWRCVVRSLVWGGERLASCQGRQWRLPLDEAGFADDEASEARDPVFQVFLFWLREL